MADEQSKGIHGIGGLYEHEIKAITDRLENRVQGLEKVVHANGRPSLEDRVRTYVDERILHARNNNDQKLVATETLIRRDLSSLKETADDRHRQTGEKIDASTRVLSATIKETEERAVEMIEKSDKKTDRLQWWILGSIGTAALTFLMQLIHPGH